MASATAAAFPCAVSARRPTRVPARAPSARSPARRRRARPPPAPQDLGRTHTMAQAKSAARKPRRKEKKNIALGHAHIKSTFNKTIVSSTDPSGAVISWASSAGVGFKGSRKSTQYEIGTGSYRERGGQY